ncbi:13041_t:CDS:2, partial [Dentiscutata erythropus]
LAGKIASIYHDNEIALVHSEDHLLMDKFSKKMTDLLAKQSRELNVKLIFEEKLIFLLLELATGTRIESDVQFLAFGAKPNIEVIKILDQSLIEQNATLVKTKPTLQLEHDNYTHIFALGDVTNIKESKLLIVLTFTLMSLGPETMMVPINKGAAHLPIGNMVVGSFMPKNFKGKLL